MSNQAWARLCQRNVLQMWLKQTKSSFKCRSNVEHIFGETDRSRPHWPGSGSGWSAGSFQTRLLIQRVLKTKIHLDNKQVQTPFQSCRSLRAQPALQKSKVNHRQGDVLKTSTSEKHLRDGTIEGKQNKKWNQTCSLWSSSRQVAL